MACRERKGVASPIRFARATHAQGRQYYAHPSKIGLNAVVDIDTRPLRVDDHFAGRILRCRSPIS